MKFNLSLPLILLLAILASCSGGKNDLDRYGLNGKVKEIRETQCDASYEDEHWFAGSDCEPGYRLMTFDEDGYYMHSMTIANEGDTLAMTIATRENGELMEENHFSGQSMTPNHRRLVAISRTIHDRVSDEQVNFEIWQQEQLRYEGATYYDSKGRVDRQVQIVNNREVIVHNVYEKNLLVEMYQVDTYGSRLATQLYEYHDFDEKGNWTLRLVYMGEEKITPELAVTRTLEYR